MESPTARIFKMPSAGGAGSVLAAPPVPCGAVPAAPAPVIADAFVSEPPFTAAPLVTPEGESGAVPGCVSPLAGSPLPLAGAVAFGAPPAPEPSPFRESARFETLRRGESSPQAPQSAAQRANP